MGEFVDDSELELFDSFSEEYNRLTGTKVKLWSLRRGHAVDPVYDEPSKKYGYDVVYGESSAPSHDPMVEPADREEWAFNGPWEFWASVQFEEEQNSDTSIEESVVTEWEATAWIARVALEAARSPWVKKGDVIEMSKEKWKDKAGNRIYFDVVSATRAGPANDTQNYVNQRLRMKRKTKFDPSRRVDR